MKNDMHSTWSDGAVLSDAEDVQKFRDISRKWVQLQYKTASKKKEKNSLQIKYKLLWCREGGGNSVYVTSKDAGCAGQVWYY